MDISITTTTISTNTTPNSTSKSPDHHLADTETPTPTPTRIINPSSKPLSFTNGVLKRHLAVPPVGVVSYKECLKNHAAALGGHALDGCGEFMPSPNADTNDPTSLKCAACGCHRNFHRREPDDHLPPPPQTAVVEYHPHHRHHPPPPRNSVSPPPISSYFPSAPHMLIALSGGGGGMQQPEHASPISRKRFRTRFSQSQKEKMYHFAEKVGWKMLKKDEDFVQEFCNEIGVEKGVFKVWMHNNKNTYGKKDDGAVGASDSVNVVNPDDRDNNDNGIFKEDNNGGTGNGNTGNGTENVNQYQDDDNNVGHVGTNGSSSSS